MKTIVAKTPGDRVRERRAALKLSQPQLAKKAGITYQAIQQLEAGGGSRHLGSIARALGVTAEWLQGGQGPAPATPTPPRRGGKAAGAGHGRMRRRWLVAVERRCDRPDRASRRPGRRAERLCRLCGG